MAKNMLVIVDMVNGFVKKGALADPTINKITPNIITLLETSIAAQDTIVFFKDEHQVNDKEFALYPPHCIKGSQEAEIIDELKSYQHYGIVISKDTTNGFVTKAFQDLISKNVYDSIIVTGCCTDICVLNFTSSLQQYINEQQLATKIRVIESCVATFDGPNHSASKEHNRALIKMQASGIDVVTKEEI